MPALRSLIVDLHLHGQLVIVVGGGAEGMKKVESLATQDCKILVISESINSRLEEYSKSGKIVLKKEKVDSTDFLDEYKPRLVMAATNDKELNRAIVEKAKSMNCLAYASDDPEVSDFAHPSVINIKDTVQVAISTRGKSPAMARKIKMKAEKIFKEIVSDEDICHIRLQDIARRAAKGKINDQKRRKEFLYYLLNDKQIKQLIKDQNFKEAEKRVISVLGEWK